MSLIKHVDGSPADTERCRMPGLAALADEAAGLGRKVKIFARIKFSAAVKTGRKLGFETQQSNNLEFEESDSAVEIAVMRNCRKKCEEVIEHVKKSLVGLAFSTAAVDDFKKIAAAEIAPQIFLNGGERLNQLTFIHSGQSQRVFDEAIERDQREKFQRTREPAAAAFCPFTDGVDLAATSREQGDDQVTFTVLGLVDYKSIIFNTRHFGHGMSR